MLRGKALSRWHKGKDGRCGWISEDQLEPRLSQHWWGGVDGHMPTIPDYARRSAKSDLRYESFSTSERLKVKSQWSSWTKQLREASEDQRLAITSDVSPLNAGEY